MTTAKQIIEIAESGDLEVQRQITSIETSADVWLSLIRTRPDLRRAVTLNKGLPIEVLAELAADEDPAVRIDVAMKRQLSAELFLLLAADRDEGVRQRIALNPKVPTDILRTLAEDRSSLVSSAARRRLQSPSATDD
jgi:hypothetical protein